MVLQYRLCTIAAPTSGTAPAHRWRLYTTYVNPYPYTVYTQYVYSTISNTYTTSALTQATGVVVLKTWFYIASWLNTPGTPATTSTTVTSYFNGPTLAAGSKVPNSIGDSYAALTTHAGVTLTYGYSGSYYIHNMKIYSNNNQATAANFYGMYSSKTPLNSPGEVILHMVEIANGIPGYYYNYEFIPFTTAFATAPPLSGFYMSPYASTTLNPDVNAWIFNDGTDDYPVPGYIVNAYPYFQFQTIPIFGALSNSDPWTVEAWVSSADITAVGTYVVFGIGDTGYYMEVNHRVTAGPVYSYTMSSVVNSVTEYDNQVVGAATAIGIRDIFWRYVVLTMYDSTVPNNLVAYVEGSTSYAIYGVPSAGFASAATSKINYLFIGGNPFESAATCHPMMRLKNIRVWRGGFSYSKMRGMEVRGYNLNWKIPEIVESFDFSQSFESLMESNRMRGYSPYKVRSTAYYSSGTAYYEAPSYYEPVMPNLLTTMQTTMIQFNDFHQCPPGHNKYNLICHADEPTMSTQSVDLRGNQVTLPLAQREISTDWTVEFWLKVRSMTTAGTSIIRQKTLDTSGFAIKRQLSTTALLVYYMQSNQVVVSSACGFGLYNWSHVEIQNSKENNRLYVYLDGTECTATTIATAALTATTRINATYDFIVGDSGTEMKMKEFRIWNTYKLRADINYYKNTYPPFSNLFASRSELDISLFNQLHTYYRMNEGQNTTLFEKVAGATGTMAVDSGLSTEDYWSNDYDLGICIPGYVYNAASMNCKRISSRYNSA